MPSVEQPRSPLRPLPVAPRPLLLRPLLAIRPRWPLGQATVAAVAVAITLFGVWGWYDASSAVMALAGAMAVLFARGEPYVHRARTVLCFGLLITAMSAIAFLASGSRWWLLGMLTLMAGAAGWATETMHTPVPGPALLLVPVTVIVGIPGHRPDELVHRVGMVGIGAGVALTVTLAPWLLLRQGPERRALTLAYRAVADALAVLGTPDFHTARNTAWAAVDQVHHSLVLARRVPGRDSAEVRRLCSLGDRAARLLQAAELAALERTPSIPPEALTRIGALPDMNYTARAPQDTRDTHPWTADAGPGERALHREIDYALTGAASTASTSGQLSAAPWLVRPPTGRRSTTVLRLMLLTLVSGFVTILIGLDRWYWAPVCAVATLWGSHTWKTWHRAAQRGLATVVGGFIGLGLLGIPLTFPEVAALVVVLFFLGELTIPRNYGIAMLFVTPMVLLTIQGASPVPLNGTVLSMDRIATTLVGCAFGVVGVLVLLPAPSTHLLAVRIAHSLRLQRRLVARSASRLADGGTEALGARIRSDLVALDGLAADALGESLVRDQARALWPIAASVQRQGYLLLALTALSPQPWPDPHTAERWQRALGDAAATVELGRPLPPWVPPGCWGPPALREELTTLLTLIRRADGSHPSTRLRSRYGTR